MCPMNGFVTTRMTTAMPQMKKGSVFARVWQWLSGRSVLVCVTDPCVQGQLSKLLLLLPAAMTCGQGYSGPSGIGGFSGTSLCLHFEPAHLPHSRLCHPSMWGGAEVLQLWPLPAPGPDLYCTG